MMRRVPTALSGRKKGACARIKDEEELETGGDTVTGGVGA
jgi:hypothetical protein